MDSNPSDERIAYPTLPKRLGSSEIRQLFTPAPHEIQWAGTVASVEKRRGLLCLLKVYQTLGRFIPPQEIPRSIVRHTARQLNLPETETLRYSTRTLRRHQQHIRKFLGIRKWDRTARDVVVSTVTELSSARAKPADLINAAIEALVRQQFELPALSTLRRITNKILQSASERIFDNVASRLSANDTQQLDRLLEVPDGSTESMFARLCRSPGRPTRRNLQALIDHVSWLASFLDPEPLLNGVSPIKIIQWAEEAKRLNAAELSEYRTHRRHTLLLTVLFDARARVLDDLVTMLIKATRKMRQKAKDDLENWLAQTRRTTERLIGLLFDIACDYQGTDNISVFYSKLGERIDACGGVSTVIEQCESRLKRRGRNWRPFTARHYRSQRTLLMDLVDFLPLQSTKRCRPLLDTLSLIVTWRSDRAEWIRFSHKLSFLDRAWQDQVCDPEEPDVFHRRTLEIASLFTLADALAAGDVWVPGSHNYGSYAAYLYPIESDQKAVESYLAERQLPSDGKSFVNTLREWLSRRSHWLEEAIYKYEMVQLSRDGQPIVPRTSAYSPTESALKLEELLLDRLPSRTILEALYNTDRWTGWTHHFGPPGRIGPQIDDPTRRYILTTFAYGCGLGATQAARHFDQPIPPHLLKFANRRHMSADDVRHACRDLIDFYAQFDLPTCWGSGESAAADGAHIETYDDNLFAAHHVRYGRTGGIAYRHVADNYVALFSRFIPCGVHEATYILDGLLDNTSNVRPKRLHADSHGQSAAVFGLAYLLGIELFPRIRNWRKLTLYRANRGHGLRTDYLYGRTIDWELIESHWNEYLRVVLAIQHGNVSSSWILTRLNSYSRQNSLYLAFQELGRVIRTGYLLQWIQNDTLRESVTAGANKVETFHRFADHLRFGSDGRLKTNDPIEQEKATVFNQLVANAVMLQTVADQTELLRKLVEGGHTVDRDDVAYFSPYITRHLKRFGQYQVHHDAEPLPNRQLFEN